MFFSINHQESRSRGLKLNVMEPGLSTGTGYKWETIITDWVDVKKLPDYYLDHPNSWSFSYKCDLNQLQDWCFQAIPKEWSFGLTMFDYFISRNEY